MSRNQEADKELLLAQLEKTPIVEAALRHIQLPRSTYYRWRRDDETFADKCDETIDLSVGRINDLAESQLINAIKNQSMPAITFWLKHHHHSYRNRLEVDARIQAVQQELTPEQEELVSRALRMSGLITNEENSDGE